MSFTKTQTRWINRLNKFTKELKAVRDELLPGESNDSHQLVNDLEQLQAYISKKRGKLPESEMQNITTGLKRLYKALRDSGHFEAGDDMTMDDLKAAQQRSIEGEVDLVCQMSPVYKLAHDAGDISRCAILRASIRDKIMAKHLGKPKPYANQVNDLSNGVAPVIDLQRSQMPGISINPPTERLLRGQTKLAAGQAVTIDELDDLLAGMDETLSVEQRLIVKNDLINLGLLKQESIDMVASNAKPVSLRDEVRANLILDMAGMPA